MWGKKKLTSSPFFTSDKIFIADENQKSIGTVSATDDDDDILVFSISGSEITINPSNGILSFVTAPDYETKSTYTATVTASDGANSTIQDLIINIINLNDNTPVFSSDATFISDENQTTIGTVNANDADGDSITHTISGSEITINPSNGILSFVSAPDYETKSTYTATVTASDGVNSATQGITVSINDLYENTNSPMFTSPASFSADENQTTIGTVNANDADGDTISFTVSGSEIGITNFSYLSSGNLTFISAPNYETKSSYTATVTANDGANSATQDITVTINDINESPEITSSAFYVLEDETAIGKVSVTDPEGDTITYSISGSEININSSSGVLTFVSAPDYETKSTYTATVTASDGALSSTKDISVTIIDGGDLWTKSSSVIEDWQGSEYGCGGDLEMNKSGNVLVCSAIGGPGVTNIYTYFANNGSWSAWIGENAPYPSQVSTQGGYGQVISLSDDGNTLAVSAPVGDGSVWAFGWNGNSWEQKNNSDNNGGSINNPGMRGLTDQGDYFGSSLSLDSDGNRIAVGTQFGNNNAGFIRVYEWTYISSVDRSQWNQIGDDMVGSNFSPGAGLGTSVALSNDGNTLIGGASDRNYANVYSYDGSSWTIEATFSGQSSDCFAASVDIDSDGDTSIVSANGCDNQNERGYVNVYRKTNGSWAQLGSSILGEYGDDGSGFKADEFGHEVSISDNGNVIAISALKNPGALDTSTQYQSAGHVRVYQYTDGDWDQLENDIDGTVKNARFGDVISLQGDGKKIVVLSDEDEKVYTYTRD